MSIPNHIPYGARQATSKRWHEAKAKKRMERGPDADTLRKRAQHDAKGMILRRGCDYTSYGESNWEVRRSIAGRVDQQDLLSNGQPFITGGPRVVAQLLAGQIK
jgi:hypothetical protein